MGRRINDALEARNSTAAGLRNPQLRTPVASVPVRGAATHRALGRWLWQFRPGCKVVRWQ